MSICSIQNSGISCPDDLNIFSNVHICLFSLTPSGYPVGFMGDYRGIVGIVVSVVVVSFVFDLSQVWSLPTSTSENYSEVSSMVSEFYLKGFFDFV